MAALTLFPLQYKRQDSVPLDIDMTFPDTASRNAYLSSPRRYAGMLVVDLQEDKAYLLNSTRTAWVPIGGTLHVQDEGVQVGSQPTSVVNFIGSGVTATTANDGATVDVTVTAGVGPTGPTGPAGGGGGGPDNIFIFQVGASVAGDHIHYATMLTSDAQSLIHNTDPAVAVGDVSQPSIVLTTEVNSGHTHDITVVFDYEKHAFVVTNITNTGTHTHEALVVGDGPVRYNTTQDVVEYRSALQGRWIDIATPKVATKTSDYTLGISDNQYIFRMNSSSPINLIIPNDSTVDIPIGTTCVLSMNGTGTTSFVASSGVTITTPSTLTIAMRYGKASITKTGANQWEVEGNVGGSTTINASGAPMGGFKAFTVSPISVTGATTQTLNLSSAFTSGNGFWYGLMDPDNPSFDWPHVKVIGGQVTLSSIGSFFVSVTAEVIVNDGNITASSPSFCSLELTDGNDNIISVGALSKLVRAAGDVSVITPPLAGITLTGWMNNDGVSGPLGSNQTVKLKVVNPYATSVSVQNVNVCFWYADTRQPRQFSA